MLKHQLLERAWGKLRRCLVIGRSGLRQGEFHIVQPKGSLDQRIARNAHYPDRDQSHLRSGREINQQFPPAAGAQQVFGTCQHLIAIIVLHHNPGPTGADDVFRLNKGTQAIPDVWLNREVLGNA